MGLFKLFFTSRRSLARLPALIQDARVPMRLKLTALGLALFIISPFNLLGDIPLLGIADDAALLALLLNWFVRGAERHAASATTYGTNLIPQQR